MFAFVLAAVLAVAAPSPPAQQYDVLISAGHEGRPQSCARFPKHHCNLGTPGERAWTPVVADEAARVLRAQGYSVAREPADFDGTYDVKAAVFIHFDGTATPCTSGASIGYHTASSQPAARLWRSEYGKVFPFRFQPDNFTDTQINGTWHGSDGAGWLTVYVSPNGHSFNSSWGYHGRKENGTFVGNKVLPPSPITSAGTWNVTGAGGSTAFVGQMTCTQSGPSTVCRTKNLVINGKFRTKDKVRATWSSGTQHGWFSYWFNGDNNSFNGIWGYGTDMTKPAGRVVGQRSLG